MLYRYVRTRRDGRTYIAQIFNLALTDHEALVRSKSYMEEFGVAVHAGTHRRAAGNHREVAAIRTGAGTSFDRIEELIAWRLSPSVSWQKGFLAGIFDAEGCFTHRKLCISNGDPTILNWIIACLDRLGFDHVVSDQRHTSKDGVAHVGIRGGIPEYMRFLLTTDPAITRKRSIVGRRLWTTAQLSVAAIEPLGVVMRCTTSRPARGTSSPTA